MEHDYILNGQGFGSVAQLVLNSGGDYNALKPFIGDDGRTYVNTINNRGELDTVLVNNVTATLRKDQWLQLDEAIITVAKPRLKAWADLVKNGLTYNVPNGMGTTIIQHQNQSDISAASVSMDGMDQSQRDRPVYDSGFLPLPIISKDFQYSARELAAAARSGSPLDTTTAKLAARRVSEELEKFVLGLSTFNFHAGSAYSLASIYGYTNFPSRITKTLTSPTVVNWTPQLLLNEILDMRAALVAAYHYGPYMLYFSTAWDKFLDDDFSLAKGDNSVRDRLGKITNIMGVQSLDYLTNYDVVMVQMDSSTVEAVTGSPMTTIQWESKGGLAVNFKVMIIASVRVRADQNGNCGLCHGTV